jgi:hypothetical protein
MTVDQLRIFISYTHDDQKIASELEGLFNGALGPAVHVFRDETSIGYGDDIRDTIVEELEKADVLVALIAGGQPASALSWVGWEMGTFETAWRMRKKAKDPRVDPSEESVVGRVVVLCNGETSLGPQSGRKTVRLGIPTTIMSEPPTDEERERFRGETRGNTELEDLVRTMEGLVEDGKHQNWIHDRQKGIDILVTDFKEHAFKALKSRVRRVYKPTKQLVVRFGVTAHPNADTGLTDEARLIFAGLTSEVFGLQQDDPSLFRKVEEPPIGVERYETTWGKFKDAVMHHRYGAYWRDVIEQAVLGAKKGGAALDGNLVLVADNEQRHRVVATTVTTFFNNDCEVSLYLIEALQRRDRGEEASSNLLNGITIVCRFRFAFLEFKSEFYHKNFRTKFGTPQAKAKELLMELDYLRSEATHANLEKPGAWMEYMSEPRLTAMMLLWSDVEIKLRAACDALLSRPVDETTNENCIEASVEEIVSQLKRIDADLRPFNAELGEAIARKMTVVFGEDKVPPAGQKKGLEYPVGHSVS